MSCNNAYVMITKNRINIINNHNNYYNTEKYWGLNYVDPQFDAWVFDVHIIPILSEWFFISSDVQILLCTLMCMQIVVSRASPSYAEREGLVNEFTSACPHIM